MLYTFYGWDPEDSVWYGSPQNPKEDGFPTLFYQHCWNYVAPSLYQFVSSVWNDLSQISSANNTLLTLIPKVNQSKFLMQFHHISLCNVIYKLNTKIMANRMKPLLNNIISLYQSSFISRRNIRHNIIIAQEMVRAMKKMKRWKVYMPIKINLEKAYED